VRVKVDVNGLTTSLKTGRPWKVTESVLTRLGMSGNAFDEKGVT